MSGADYGIWMKTEARPVNAEQLADDITVITAAYARKVREMLVRLWGWIRWEVFYRWYARLSVKVYEFEKARDSA